MASSSSHTTTLADDSAPLRTSLRAAAFPYRSWQRVITRGLWSRQATGVESAVRRTHEDTAVGHDRCRERLAHERGRPQRLADSAATASGREGVELVTERARENDAVGHRRRCAFAMHVADPQWWAFRC